MDKMLTERMTEEQVHGLLEEYLTTKDIRLRDKIILQYKNLVESIARRFLGSGEPLEDLIQEGYVGLITATDLYDAEKGVKFSTYATHFIIGQIKHALRDRGKIIKEPAWLQELNHRMARVIEALYQDIGRQPTNAEIGKVMRLPEETVAELLTTREIFKVSSLDCDQDENSGGAVDVEKVRDDRYTTFQLPVEDKIVLEMSVNKLKLIEQKVIQEFFYKGHTQTEIAKKLGISCNYVSHILRSGTKKLRRILTTEEIKEMQMQLQLANRRAAEPAPQPDVVDGLTGLYNAEYMEGRLVEEISRAVRYKTEVAFAVVDVEGLEEYGKRFGSMRRDDAISELVRAIRSSVRRCDIIGRLGDSEFGMILLHTNNQAEKVCGRVRMAMQGITLEKGDAQGGPSFAVNIGLAVYPIDGTHAEDLMNIAREVSRHKDEKIYRKAA